MTQRIKNLKDLRDLRDQMFRTDGLTRYFHLSATREVDLVTHHKRLAEESGITTQILVCVGGGCLASGSQEIGQALQESVKARGLARKVKVVETGCMGPCSIGPVIKIMPDGVFYRGLTPADADEIVEKHVIGGQIVTRLTYEDTVTGQRTAKAEDIEYFKKQKKIVLRNCGLIDPLKIEEYIALDGYQALAKALTAMSPDEVVEAVTKSGLRGRGGGGFPTGIKWGLTRKAKGDRKKGSKRSRQLAEAKPGKSKSAKKTAKADSAVSSKKTKKGVADAAKKSHKAGAKSDRKSRRSS